MDTVHEDSFLVFVRSDRSYSGSPESVEQEVINCSTYEEARRVRGEYHAHARECVIRYVGDSGGGD